MTRWTHVGTGLVGIALLGLLASACTDGGEEADLGTEREPKPAAIEIPGGGPPPTWVMPTRRVDSNFPNGVLQFNTATDFANFYRAFDDAGTATGSVIYGTHNFSTTNTNSAQQNYASVSIKVTTGQTLDVGTCGVTGSSFAGNTYLRLFNGGTSVAVNDDACAGTGSRITYTATSNTTLQVRIGCISSSTCSGTVAYNLSSPAGGTGITSGAMSYSAATSTNFAQQNHATLSLQLTQGQVLDIGTCGLTGSAFTSDTYLRLLFNGATVTVNDDACGGHGSRITYTAPASGNYQVNLGCYSAITCTGTAAYTISQPPTQAQMLPAGFTSAAAYLAGQAPNDPSGDALLDVTEAEYLNDLKVYLTEEDSLRQLVDSELQIVVANQLYQLTNIGLMRVDISAIPAYRSWLAANAQNINREPTYTAVPGEVALGGGAYRIMTGVTRLTEDVGLPSVKYLGYDEDQGGGMLFAPAAHEDRIEGDTSAMWRTASPSALTAGDGLAIDADDARARQLADGGDTHPEFEPLPVAVELGRISYWSGKVNTHKSPGGSWVTDGDCQSGALVDPLTYCKKFWPSTTSAVPVSVTAKTGNIWFNAGCGLSYPGNGLQEWVCDGSAPSCGQSSPTVQFQNYAVGENFKKSENITFGNRRFVFKTKNVNVLGLGLIRTIGIKGKLQRKKRVWFVTYWGPSYADEIVVGFDNMYLWTTYQFPTPPLVFTSGRPSFSGLADYKLGNVVLQVINFDVGNYPALINAGITQQNAYNFVNGILNNLVNSVVTNLIDLFALDVVNVVDPSLATRFANLTKKFNSLDESYHFRIVMTKGERPQCYSHSNRWTFNPNVGFGGAEYRYEMRAGSFWGRARLGTSWYGIRMVRQ